MLTIGYLLNINIFKCLIETAMIKYLLDMSAVECLIILDIFERSNNIY